MNEFINNFRKKDKNQVSMLKAEATMTANPRALEASWDNSKHRMYTDFGRLVSFWDASKEGVVQKVTEREEERKERIRRFTLLTT